MGDNEDMLDICLRVGGTFVPKRVSKDRQLLCWCGGWCYWRRNVQVSKLDVQEIRTAAIHGFVQGDMEVPVYFNCWYRQKGKTFNTGRRELLNSDEVRGLLETINAEGYVEVFVTAQTNLKPKSQAQPNPPLKDKVSTKGKKGQSISTVRRSPRFKKTEAGRKESPPRDNLVTKKGKGNLAETGVSGSLKEKSKGKGKASAKAKALVFDEDDVGGNNESDYSSSDLSDEDLDWEPGEEEFDEGDEEWFIEGSKEILDKVNKSLRKLNESGIDQGAVKDKRSDLRDDLDIGTVSVNPEADDCDSESSRSLCGSDSEEDTAPWFNEDVDFQKPIQLQLRQKFKNAGILRRVLRLHAIQERYEFYFLHNDSRRITVQCRYRCDCQFNTYTCRMPACTCVGGVKCHFKVYASKLVGQETWQIKSCKLKHTCLRVKKNRMITAEYIADRYLEEFRSNSAWRIKDIRARVLNDLGIEVTYFKAWMARCRAKLIIFGSAREQYARVWDYGKAVMKYNPGSRCNVVVEGIESPEPPLFLRMFMCLRPLRDGFAKGCRLMIGVDGCHLKGGYPGQILVAVAKDGNNNLFPLAWATVEAENKDSWGWFLQSLMAMFTHDQGAGLTIMSDRQKGLLEAMDDVVPKAEKRFCVRHIWANFKLKFTGSTYKELFWAAARSTTEFNFKFAMDSIKELSEEAYDYLVKIPTKSWSRHAFSSNCKSNILLNNMCETFNAVIRPARDKPILTQMEWMRRYVMNRNNEKWEDSKTITSNLTPYVRNVLARIEFVARKCVVQPSRGSTFEVQLMDDQECVDLEKESCTCYHWELTGIPCVHAYACMMDMRGDMEAYVDPCYTMDSYRKTYEPPIQPMHGPKHWERVKMREPHPPAFKVQPGRPKSKKRKLEPGESSTATGQPVTAKRKKQCSKCAGFGHYAKTCKKPAAPATAATNVPRPPGRPASNTPWVVEERKKKEARATKKSSSQPSTIQPSSSQPKTKQQPKSKPKASSSQPEPTTTQEPNTNFLISSSQPAPTTGQQPTHTGVITRSKLQKIRDVNLTQ